MVERLVLVCRWMNQAVTRSLVASLPRVVAIWLILAMIMGSMGGAVILSYKVGMETKDAIVIMKTHVQSNNYAEKIGLSQWIEENNVSQQIDTYWVQAYDTLMQQVDVFVEKNNLTEAAEVGKEFLRGAPRKPTVIGAENETEAAALDIPSHPLVERLQDIKVSPPLTFHTCSVITVLLGIISFVVVEQNPIFVQHFSHKVQSYD
jgi:hypothetical protein